MVNLIDKKAKRVASHLNLLMKSLDILENTKATSGSRITYMKRNQEVTKIVKVERLSKSKEKSNLENLANIVMGFLSNRSEITSLERKLFKSRGSMGKANNIKQKLKTHYDKEEGYVRDMRECVSAIGGKYAK